MTLRPTTEAPANGEAVSPDPSSQAFDPSPSSTPLSRRRLLRGAAAGAAVVAVAGVAACGDSPSSAQPSGGSTPAGGTTPDGSGSSGGATSGGGAVSGLVAASEVPVGGGTIVDQRVVVTQPVAGEFRGFTAICTHQRCPLASVDGGTINCTCHGSKFSIEDGSVRNPPATEPLAAIAVQLQGDQIVEA